MSQMLCRKYIEFQHTFFLNFRQEKGKRRKENDHSQDMRDISKQNDEIELGTCNKNNIFS